MDLEDFNTFENLPTGPLLLNSDPSLGIVENDLDQILANCSSDPLSPLHFDLDDLYGKVNDEQMVWFNYIYTLVVIYICCCNIEF